MSEDLRFPVETRSRLGSAETRRMRQNGRTPANLYGLGKSVESVSVCSELVEKLVATRSSVVDVELNGVVEKAVVQELQWDVFSTHVRHVDLKRVDPAGVTTVDVPIELRGEAVGLKDGGMIRQLSKTIRITCPDYRIPKSIVVRVGALQMGDSVKASDVQLPEHSQLSGDPDVVLVELYDPRKV